MTITDERARRDHSEGGRDMQAANLFDLRRIIGALFLIYGTILVVVGLGDGGAEISKSAGVHINLLAGLGMLGLGAFFLVWAFARPLGEQLAEAEAETEAGADDGLVPDEHARAGAGRDRDRFVRDGDAGRKQPQHVAAESAADHPRTGRTGPE
jgi:hypothetical protein